MKSIALILIVLVAVAIAAPTVYGPFGERAASPIAILFPNDDLKLTAGWEPDHDSLTKRVLRKTSYVTVPVERSYNPPPPQYQPQEPQNTGLFAGATSAWKDTTGKALSFFTGGNSKSANF